MDTDPRKISVCFTHYNRADMLLKTITTFLHDDRVEEIVIVDDCSEYGQYNKLEDQLKSNEKVFLVRNSLNIGCYKNKRKAVLMAANEFVCILDSDNVFDKSYLDKIYEYGLWDNNTIYAPSFARPFDYRHFEGRVLTKQNISKFVSEKRFDALLNTMNYFVNKSQYLRVWDDKATPYAIDSIYQNFRWISAGNKILVVKGLEYDHTVHKGSLYMKEGHLTNDLHNALIYEFKKMK